MAVYIFNLAHPSLALQAKSFACAFRYNHTVDRCFSLSARLLEVTEIWRARMLPRVPWPIWRATFLHFSSVLSGNDIAAMMVLPLILAFCMAAAALADYPYVNWTYPTGPIQRDNASNLTVHIGDTLDAVWTSTWVEDHDRGPWIEMHCGPGNLARSSLFFCPTACLPCFSTAGELITDPTNF